MHRGFAAAVAATFVIAVPASAQHTHEEQGVHSHRGPGPHFIDAFFTENAYIERKLRPDVFVATGDGEERYTARLEVEWALVSRFSLLVHAPVHHVVPVGAPSETGVGDVTAGAKLALVNDRERFILAAGGDVELPTGDEARGLGEGHAAAAPFLLAWLPFGPERRWLIQGGGHLDVPLEAGHETHAELSAALSWTSPAGVTPIVEGIVELAPSGGPASWAVAPEFRWEFAPAWELGAAVRVPVGGPAEEDVRVAVGAIRHFALPR